MEWVMNSSPLVYPPLGAPTPRDKTNVTVCNGQLWMQFNKHTTEMIITKQGRRMFPTLEFDITLLDPERFYNVFIDIVPADNDQWKYQKGKWVAHGQAEELPSEGRVYLHPAAPNKGAYWMRQKVTFPKLKLTNNKSYTQSCITLHSMHKYLPRLHIIEVGGDLSKERSLYSYAFPFTEFIAVTAYQNMDITQLKIDNNPFAKGFRDQVASSRPPSQLDWRGTSTKRGSGEERGQNEDPQTSEQKRKLSSGAKNKRSPKQQIPVRECSNTSVNKSPRRRSCPN